MATIESPVCHIHYSEYGASKEYQRACALRDRGLNRDLTFRVALMDFINRVNAENANGQT